MSKLLVVFGLVTVIMSKLFANSIVYSHFKQTNKDQKAAIMVDTDSSIVYLTYVYRGKATALSDETAKLVQKVIKKTVCENKLFSAAIKKGAKVIVTYIYDDAVVHSCVDSCD